MPCSATSGRELVQRIDEALPAVHHFSVRKKRNANLADAIPRLIGGFHVHDKVIHGAHFVVSIPAFIHTGECSPSATSPSQWNNWRETGATCPW
jgi:hypothetical protein